MSLQNLLLAMQNVQILCDDQDRGSVTIVSELSLNICNAYNFLGNNQKALEFGFMAVRTAKECIAFLTKKLDQPMADKNDTKK
jgi:hypothetical protein